MNILTSVIKPARFLRSLSDVDIKKIKTIAKIRNESNEVVVKKFGIKNIQRAPASFSKHIPLLNYLDIKKAGKDKGLAFIQLRNGRIFYSYISKENHQKCYEFVKDIIPDTITSETFLAALDVAHRYSSSFSWPAESITPPVGGRIIECGAYLGHKTIAFVDRMVGKSGKILAIEMIPENADILRINVDANKLSNEIDVIESGVWFKKDSILVRGKGRQRNTLVKLDKLDNSLEIVVQVDTLDNFINNWNEPFIDLVFMTINGAEVEALEGLQQKKSMVGAMFIAAPYSRDGHKSTILCRNILKEMGFCILNGSTGSRLLVKNNSI